MHVAEPRRSPSLDGISMVAAAMMVMMATMVSAVMLVMMVHAKQVWDDLWNQNALDLQQEGLDVESRSEVGDGDGDWDGDGSEHLLHVALVL